MKEFLFKLIKWLIRKYFNNGLTAIYGTGEMEEKIIAWKWMFYDEDYEDMYK